MAHDGAPPLDVFDWWRSVRESDVSPLARTCAWAIGLHADRETLEAFPSQATLARAMGYESVRQVRRAVRELREAGLLDVQKRGPGRGALYTPRRSGTSGQSGAATNSSADTGDESDLRGRAAQLVREHWWRARRPPPDAPPGWHMGQEYGFLDPCAKRNGWPVVTAAIPLVRDVFSLDGEPFTGKLVFARATRARWEECLARGLLSVVDSGGVERTGTSGRTVSEILEEVSL